MLSSDQRTMQNGARFAPQRPGAERRRERRYEVDLPGDIQIGPDSWPVQVSDLSASGALIATAGLDVRIEAGTRIVLLLREFGTIDAAVAHAGSDFCGVQFLHPHLFRDKLMAWLRTAAGPA